MSWLAGILAGRLAVGAGGVLVGLLVEWHLADQECAEALVGQLLRLFGS